MKRDQVVGIAAAQGHLRGGLPGLTVDEPGDNFFRVDAKFPQDDLGTKHPAAGAAFLEQIPPVGGRVGKRPSVERIECVQEKRPDLSGLFGHTLLVPIDPDLFIPHCLVIIHRIRITEVLRLKGIAGGLEIDRKDLVGSFAANILAQGKTQVSITDLNPDSLVNLSPQVGGKVDRVLFDDHFSVGTQLGGRKEKILCLGESRLPQVARQGQGPTRSRHIDGIPVQRPGRTQDPVQRTACRTFLSLRMGGTED